MARWKKNNDGSAYYDPNDESNVNQIDPPPGASQPPSPSGTPPAPPQPPAPQGFDWGSAQNAGESQAQTYQRYQNDYHSDDRDHVLGQMQQEMAAPAWHHEQTGVYQPFSQQSATPSQTPQPQPSAWQPTLQNAPPGFDQAKWADPTQGTSQKYTVGRILAGGGTIEQAAQAVGAKVISPDKIQFPDGFIADVFRDTEGAHQVQYTQVGGPDPNDQKLNGGAQGFSNIPGGSSGMYQSQLGAGSGTGYMTDPGNYGARGNELYDMLMGRAQQGLNVSPQDPVIAGQVNSFRAEQERGARNAIDQAAARGGPGANMGSESRLASEHAAQQTGSMQAQLMQNELTSRRGEIQNALSQMGSMLSDQQKMALQREMNQIDASLRQQQVNNSHSEFLDQLGLNAEDRASYWDALRSGLL